MTIGTSTGQTAVQQFVRFLRYARPYRGRIILAIVSLFLIALLNAISIGALQPVFDGLFIPDGSTAGLSLPGPIKVMFGHQLGRLQQFMQEQRINVLLFLGAVLFVVFLAKGALTYLQQVQMRYVSEAIQRDIRNELYARVQTLPLRFFTQRQTGEIMSRFSSDVESVGDASTDLFRNALR
ncbi:MAG TPA: ABC transporter transmembrane domain-containing protein, partial [Dehalococcoidia bacterium]|nr:ABC transporter transmembrane domain-containing protein [Dehalococcoidia bacterium]